MTPLREAMTLAEADPWFGDIVAGPDGTEGRVCGSHLTADRKQQFYTVEFPDTDRPSVEWELRDIRIVRLNPDSLPLEYRIGRANVIAVLEVSR